MKWYSNPEESIKILEVNICDTHICLSFKLKFQEQKIRQLYNLEILDAISHRVKEELTQSWSRAVTLEV